MLGFLSKLSDPELWRRGAQAGIEALGPMRHVPGLRNMVAITPESPLKLFDSDAYQKILSDAGGNAAAFFSGRSLHIGPGRLHSLTAPNESVAKFRKGFAWGTGGLLGANLLGLDPFGAVSATTNVAKFGAHAFIGSTMFGMGGKARMLGTAYLGLLGWNTLKSGNQWGPM